MNRILIIIVCLVISGYQMNPVSCMTNSLPNNTQEINIVTMNGQKIKGKVIKIDRNSQSITLNVNGKNITYYYNSQSTKDKSKIIDYIVEEKLSKGSNTLPMYGGHQKSAEEKKIDDDFIKNVEKQMSRKDGSKYYVKQGWNFFDKKDYLSAMKRFNQAWLLDPNNPDVYWGYAMLLQQDGKDNEALSMYNKTIQLKPAHFEAYLNRGNLYLMKKEAQKAIQDYQKAIKINPKEAQVYNDLAVAQFALQQYTESKKNVEIAIKLGYKPHPDFLRALNSHK